MGNKYTRLETPQVLCIKDLSFICLQMHVYSPICQILYIFELKNICYRSGIGTCLNTKSICYSNCKICNTYKIIFLVSCLFPLLFMYMHILPLSSMPSIPYYSTTVGSQQASNNMNRPIRVVSICHLCSYSHTTVKIYIKPTYTNLNPNA